MSGYLLIKYAQRLIGFKTCVYNWNYDMCSVCQSRCCWRCFTTMLSRTPVHNYWLASSSPAVCVHLSVCLSVCVCVCVCVVVYPYSDWTGRLAAAVRSDDAVICVDTMLRLRIDTLRYVTSHGRSASHSQSRSAYTPLNIPSLYDYLNLKILLIISIYS